VRFSRFNIFADGTASYATEIAGTELNLDHVIPRSRGGCPRGRTSCARAITCNRRKGGRTPDEAGCICFRRRAARMDSFSSEMFSLRRYRDGCRTCAGRQRVLEHRTNSGLIACAAGGMVTLPTEV